MTNGLRMDSTRQRALFQTFSGGLSSKTTHISNTNKRKSIPDGTNDPSTESPPLCKVLKIVQQNGLELECSSNNSKEKKHEDSDDECDSYELLEIDYDDDCPSDDSDVMLIEDTQKAIVIEDDDVDGGQSNSVSSREGKIPSSGSKTSCDGNEAIDQNTIVIEDEDEEDSRLSCDDRTKDNEEDNNSNNSSVIEYERWMSFRSTDDNDDDRVSCHESIVGEFNHDAHVRISGDHNYDEREEEKTMSHREHNRGSESDSNLTSAVIEHERNDRVSIDNEVNADAHDKISNNHIENNVNCIVIEDEDQEAKVSKSCKTNGHSSIANEDDKIIVIDDDDDDDDEETVGKTDLSHVEDDTCSYTLVDVIDTVENEIPKPTKRESVVRNLK